MKSAKQTIYEMLTTCTGSHMLDSGGAYGRHWERNKGKSLEDFENEPTVTWEVWDSELNYIISVFHYLNNQLETDQLCEHFNNKMGCEDWDSDIYGISKHQEDFLKRIGAEFGRTINTYNHEDFLSQTLQYTHLTINDEYYVLIQLHQGCDVRGGYTDAKLFKLDNEYCYDGGCLNPQDVFGNIDGVEVSNCYDGVNITDDENGETVKVTENSKIVLELMMY